MVCGKICKFFTNANLIIFGILMVFMTLIFLYQKNAFSISDEYQNNSETRVLIYGNFYSKKLLPQLDIICKNSNKLKIFRSEVYRPHDVVILHFDHYHRFMRAARRHKIHHKKVMIIFFMVFHFLKKEPPWVLERINIPTINYQYNIFTSSYHKSSAFPGKYCRFAKKSHQALNIKKLNQSFYARKTAAFALISNCEDKYSTRLEYISELKKHFPVDEFGECFNNKFSGDVQMLYEKYKFFISFENSICEDYVTEKYCKPLLYGSIPIVASPDFNLNHYLNDSYINAFDFQNPKKLAYFLNNVSANFSLYKTYFLWNEDFFVSDIYVSIDSCPYIDNILKIFDQNIAFDLVGNRIGDTRYCINVNQQRSTFLRKI